jgi:hypothetical protein
MPCEWNEKTGELTFSADRIEGILDPVVRGGQGDSISHRLRNFRHKPSDTLVSPDLMNYGPCQAGLLSLFKVLARSCYLTELRVLHPDRVEVGEAGVTLVWAPTLQHQARVACGFTVKEPNIFELDLQVEGYGYYPDYEILVSMYLAPGFVPGVYVKERELTAADPVQIRVVDHPTYHGTYPCFPRDEAAAHILTDGRGQSGRYYWRQTVGRVYGVPVGFYTNETIDVVVMGRPEDVQAIGASYAGDEERDGVAAHRSMYLSLFGRDLYPGHSWRTQIRMAVDDWGARQAAHMQLYQDFLSEVRPLERTSRTNPKEV